MKQAANILRIIPLGRRLRTVVVLGLLLGCSGTLATAQSARRITFSAGGVDRGRTPYTLTIGEAVVSGSAHGRSYHLGYQQSYPTSTGTVLVWADSTHAAPRSRTNVGIYLSVGGREGKYAADSLDVSVRYNSSLLVPQSVSPGRIIADHYEPTGRTTTVRVPSGGSSDHTGRVATITFAVALGDDTSTVVDVVNAVFVAANTNVRFLYRDGLVSIDSLCYEGGVRLVRQAHLALRAFPNPMADDGTVEVTTGISADATIELRSLLGQPLRTIPLGVVLPGRTHLQLDLDEVPSGTYVLALVTADEVVTIPLTVSR